MADRIPVLSYGSNASPPQLRRKFDSLPDTVFPCLEGRLRDFDVVYSAHFTSYGSIPATLQFYPGTLSDLFVTFLTVEQLRWLSRSEAVGINYALVRLIGIHLTLADGTRLSDVLTYVGLHGSLTIDNEEIALREVGVSGRRIASLGQRELQITLRDRLQPTWPIHQFILEAVRDNRARHLRTARLRTEAKAFAYSKVEAVEAE